MMELTDKKYPGKSLYDRIYIEYKNVPGVVNFPLCEILDGRLTDIGDDAIKLKELNGKTVVYDFQSFIGNIDRAISDNKKITSIWLQVEGSKTQERIL